MKRRGYCLAIADYVYHRIQNGYTPFSLCAIVR